MIFFNLNTIPMTLYENIMLISISKYIFHVCNLNILWPPLKNRMPQNFTIANFRHPLSTSWLRPCFGHYRLAWVKQPISHAYIIHYRTAISNWIELNDLGAIGGFGRYSHEWVIPSNAEATFMHGQSASALYRISTTDQETS